MMIRIITRTAAGIASTGIAALPLAIGASAHAINKHEGGSGGSSIVSMTSDTERQIDLAQVSTGALAGATVAGAAFAASTRFRRHRDTTLRPT